MFRCKSCHSFVTPADIALRLPVYTITGLPIHVNRDAVQYLNPLSSSFFPSVFPQSQVFQWSAVKIRWPNIRLQLSIGPSKSIQELISFSIGWTISLAELSRCRSAANSTESDVPSDTSWRKVCLGTQLKESCKVKYVGLEQLQGAWAWVTPVCLRPSSSCSVSLFAWIIWEIAPARIGGLQGTLSLGGAHSLRAHARLLCSAREAATLWRLSETSPKTLLSLR